MTEDCVFCRIVSGEVPSRMVYETDAAVAFLDANPITEGHTLVVPKDHYDEMRDLPEGVAAEVFGAIPRVVRAVEDAVDADGSTVGFNNGGVAGQHVPHVHGHVVPRFRGDGGGSIHSVVRGRASLSDEEFDDAMERIRERV